jgi:hypothetical protein
MDLTVVPVVSREDYPELLSIVEDNNSFPADYDSFVQLYDNMMRDYQKTGRKMIKINIKPGELAEWCRSQNRKVDSKARGDYAIFLYEKS